jgi:hypothetical protein
VRGFFTGTNFDGSGRSMLDWITAARGENAWGLERFYEERAFVALAPRPVEREAALARALVAAGAIMHLVEDAADPAHVRNDYRVALDEGERAYERFVAARYGRFSVPEPVPPPSRPAHLLDIIHDARSEGLADRTQRRFFSPGVLWSLDDRCYADYAEALLPEAGRAAVAALEFLFRGALELTREGDEVKVTARDVELGEGELVLLGEDQAGLRTVLGSPLKVGRTPDGGELSRIPFRGSPGLRKIAAIYRGRDAAAEKIVLTAELSAVAE